MAGNATKVYGQALPSFTVMTEGFVNGDTTGSLGGALIFSTAATAQSAPGQYSVTPSGYTSTNYAITFVPGALTIVKASTQLTLSSSPNPSRPNQAVQITAVVSPVAPGAGAASGVIEFRDNGTVIGSASVVNGVATISVKFKKGSHSLTATYAGDANFTGSSDSVSHQTN
jgi:hypothetical protein